MELIQELNTHIINARRYMTLIILILITGTLLTIILAKVSQIFIVGIFIFWIGPFFIQKRLKKPFFRKVCLDFYTDKISIKVFKRGDENLDDELEIFYSQIKAFKTINSSRDDTSFLKIVTKTGRVVKYTFVDQSNEGKSTDVTDVVKKYIRKFNSEHLPQDKIALLPSFFATKSGSIYIGILTLALIVVIIVQIIYKPGSIPFSIFAGLALTMQIIFQRKKDLNDLQDYNSNVEEK